MQSTVVAVIVDVAKLALFSVVAAILPGRRGKRAGARSLSSPRVSDLTARNRPFSRERVRR